MPTVIDTAGKHRKVDANYIGCRCGMEYAVVALSDRRYTRWKKDLWRCIDLRSGIEVEMTEKQLKLHGAITRIIGGSNKKSDGRDPMDALEGIHEVIAQLRSEAALKDRELLELRAKYIALKTENEKLSERILQLYDYATAPNAA